MQRTIGTGHAEVAGAVLVARLEAEACQSPAVLARLSPAKTSQLHVTQQKDFGVSVLDVRGLVWCIAVRAPGSIASGEGLVYARVRRCAGFRSIFALRATHSLTP